MIEGSSNIEPTMNSFAFTFKPSKLNDDKSILTFETSIFPILISVFLVLLSSIFNFFISYLSNSVNKEEISISISFLFFVVKNSFV